ncbi:TPA: hypothetical protein ACF2PS_002861, partial [Legionella pneumophila]
FIPKVRQTRKKRHAINLLFLISATHIDLVPLNRAFSSFNSMIIFAKWPIVSNASSRFFGVKLIWDKSVIKSESYLLTPYSDF